MFFLDCRVAPASRPIEFRDDRVAVFDTDLVNAVFVTVQREEASVATKT